MGRLIFCWGIDCEVKSLATRRLTRAIHFITRATTRCHHNEDCPLASGGAHKLRTRGFVAGFDGLQSFASAVSLDAIPKDLLVEVVEGVVPHDHYDVQFLRNMFLLAILRWCFVASPLPQPTE